MVGWSVYAGDWLTVGLAWPGPVGRLVGEGAPREISGGVGADDAAVESAGDDALGGAERGDGVVSLEGDAGVVVSGVELERGARLGLDDELRLGGAVADEDDGRGGGVLDDDVGLALGGVAAGGEKESLAVVVVLLDGAEVGGDVALVKLLGGVGGREVGGGDGDDAQVALVEEKVDAVLDAGERLGGLGVDEAGVEEVVEDGAAGSGQQHRDGGQRRQRAQRPAERAARQALRADDRERDAQPGDQRADQAERDGDGLVRRHQHLDDGGDDGAGDDEGAEGASAVGRAAVLVSAALELGVPDGVWGGGVHDASCLRRLTARWRSSRRSRSGPWSSTVPGRPRASFRGRTRGRWRGAWRP